MPDASDPSDGALLREWPPADLDGNQWSAVYGGSLRPGQVQEALSRAAKVFAAHRADLRALCPQVGRLRAWPTSPPGTCVDAVLISSHPRREPGVELFVTVAWSDGRRWYGHVEITDAGAAADDAFGEPPLDMLDMALRTPPPSPPLPSPPRTPWVGGRHDDEMR